MTVIHYSQEEIRFWLRVEWLWQEPLPYPLRALGQIASVDTEVVERFLRALGGQSGA